MQVVDPWESPSLTALNAVQLVQRFNACSVHVTPELDTAVDKEVLLLCKVADKIIQGYVVLSSVAVGFLPYCPGG